MVSVKGARLCRSMRLHLQLHQGGLHQALYGFHLVDDRLHHDRAGGGGFELHGLTGYGQGAEDENCGLDQGVMSRADRGLSCAYTAP